MNRAHKQALAEINWPDLSVGGTARFVGQIYTSSRFSRSGDSGSLVDTSDSNENPVGLLFAGTNPRNSLLNPIATALNRFNATICSQ